MATVQEEKECGRWQGVGVHRDITHPVGTSYALSHFHNALLSLAPSFYHPHNLQSDFVFFSLASLCTVLLKYELYCSFSRYLILTIFGYIKFGSKNCFYLNKF